MSSDVVLSAALRNNLLSLQNTQRLIDSTQLRLATGLKVNSALDNPQNFFTAQALNNRAGDLERLLDGISQSIRTIEEADKGITALSKLVEQAQSIVQSARDELAASEGEARLVGTVDLSEFDDLSADLGIAAGDAFVINTTDDSGVQITETVTLLANDTVYSLAARITDAFADNEAGEITASVTDQGYLSIQSKNGRSFSITTTAANELTIADLDALGIGDYFELSNRSAGGGTNLAASTIVAGNTIRSISLYEAPGDLVEAGDAIFGNAYTDAEGNAALDLDAGASITLTINTTTTSVNTGALAGATASFQDLVDSINSNVNLNQLVSAEFDSKTGQIAFTALDDSVENIQLTVGAAANGDVIGWGLGDATGDLDAVTSAGGAEDFTFRFNNSTQVLDRLAGDYNTLRGQIDTLVNDAQYRGINLLNGDDLVTFFNENNTSRLTTSGAIFTANGLGITEASFRSSAEIENSAAQARAALDTVRSFGSTLANNLSIIQARREFTEGTVTTLKAGADDLTVADQNEEGANLLALQTRQQLGVTSLSLAAQSQQSVLRLF